jgi:hypothetical protein
MLLMRDLLDNQMVDRDKRKIGKVDGIVLQCPKGKPPRVAWLEQGAVTLARRIGPRWERLAETVSRRLGVRKEPCFRIRWEKVLEVKLEVVVDIDGRKSPAWAWEHWLRVHLAERLPFGKHRKGSDDDD